MHRGFLIVLSVISEGFLLNASGSARNCLIVDVVVLPTHLILEGQDDAINFYR